MVSISLSPRYKSVIVPVSPVVVIKSLTKVTQGREGLLDSQFEVTLHDSVTSKSRDRRNWCMPSPQLILTLLIKARAQPRVRYLPKWAGSSHNNYPNLEKSLLGIAHGHT